jgi:hypothetical protein
MPRLLPMLFDISPLVLRIKTESSRIRRIFLCKALIFVEFRQVRVEYLAVNASCTIMILRKDILKLFLAHHHPCLSYGTAPPAVTYPDMKGGICIEYYRSLDLFYD